MSEDLLTVLVITYNHAKYFRKCMENILSQKTSFGFKIYVLDDKSTDGTSDIVREYANKYPDKVVPFIRENNLGLEDNIYKGIESVQTKYYATIESDDFWCDDSKLQKQVDILENNPDCSFCGHNTIHNYPENTGHKDNGKKFFKIKTQKFNFLKKNNKKKVVKVHLNSRVYRTSSLALDTIKNKAIPAWDSTSYWWFLSKGNLYYIDEVMSVYNITDTGVYSGTSKEKKRLMAVKRITEINKELEYKYNCFYVDALRRKKYLSFFKHIKLKYFTKLEKMEQEYCKILGKL